MCIRMEDEELFLHRLLCTSSTSFSSRRSGELQKRCTRKPYSITSRTHSLRDKVNGAAYPLFSDINDISSLTANKRGRKTNSFTTTGKTKKTLHRTKENEHIETERMA